MAKIAEDLVPISIQWHDHWFDDRDFDPKELAHLKPVVITTKGFYAGENKQLVVVCQNQLDDKQLSECTYIMKKCIIYRSDKVKKDAEVS